MHHIIWSECICNKGFTIWGFYSAHLAKSMILYFSALLLCVQNFDRSQLPLVTTNKQEFGGLTYENSISLFFEHFIPKFGLNSLGFFWEGTYFFFTRITYSDFRHHASTTLECSKTITSWPVWLFICDFYRPHIPCWLLRIMHAGMPSMCFPTGTRLLMVWLNYSDMTP